MRIYIMFHFLYNWIYSINFLYLFGFLIVWNDAGINILEQNIDVVRVSDIDLSKINWGLRWFLTSGKLYYNNKWLLQMQNVPNQEELKRVKNLINLKYTENDVKRLVKAVNNNATGDELNLIILRIFGQRITDIYIDDKFVSDTKIFSSDLKMMSNSLINPSFKEHYLSLCNNNIVNTAFFTLIIDRLVSIIRKLKDNNVDDILYNNPPAYISFRFTKRGIKYLINLYQLTRP